MNENAYDIPQYYTGEQGKNTEQQNGRTERSELWLRLIFFIDDYENILMLSFLLFSPFVHDAQVRPKVAIAN